MPEKEPGRGDPLGPLDWRKMFPFEQAAARDRPGWMGLGAAHYRPEPVFERNVPALTHHRLFLVIRPPEELDLRYEGVKRHVPPPAGAIMLVPAGSPAWARSSGYKDALHIFLEPGLVARVAAEAFGLDPARLTVPPLDGLDLPHLRAASATTQERARAVIASRAAPTTTESLPESQESELFRMIEPPSRMMGRALTTVIYAPCTLRSQPRWKCSSVTSPNLANSTTPAFAKRTSIALVSSMIRA